MDSFKDKKKKSAVLYNRPWWYDGMINEEEDVEMWPHWGAQPAYYPTMTNEGLVMLTPGQRESFELGMMEAGLRGS